jgi:hypothetical protein
LIEKHPYLITSDTVTIHDTIRVEIPAVQLDTVFKIDQLTDTIEIIKDHYHTKIWTVRDSIFVEGGCDTIRVDKIVERRIPVKYYEKKTPFWTWFLIAGLLILLITIYRILWQRSN